MHIIPAVYIQNGQCVSLYKGHENSQKLIYSESPARMASHFSHQGADSIHIVDLDRSTGHRSNNFEVICKLTSTVDMPVQVAGGISDLDYIDRLIHHKISKVIIGYSGRHIIQQAIRVFGKDKIIGGIKAKKNLIDSQSLLLDEKVEVLDYARQLEDMGIQTIIYKDIESEGTLFPHYDEVDRLLTASHAKIYLSGGISTYVQLDTFKKIGLHGVIISKAFMEGKLSLKKSLEKYQYS